MDLSIVERLVCPNPHAMSPLVARADVSEGRDMRAGVVGCPVCRQEWRVTDGIARFGMPSALPAADAPDAMTSAALLGLTEPQRLTIVDGAPSTLVRALSDDFGAVVVALDAPTDARAAANIEGAAAVPLATAHAALLLRPDRSTEFVESVVRALTAGARLVATATLTRPASIREIARDLKVWVGEKEAVSAPIELRRG